MIIKTDKDGNCGGQSKLLIPYESGNYYVVYKFGGTYSGSTLKFKDESIVDHKDPTSPGFYWCKKSGTLKLDGNSLTGDISGYSPSGNCLPAKVNMLFVSKDN